MIDAYNESGPKLHNKKTIRNVYHTHHSEKRLQHDG